MAISADVLSAAGAGKQVPAALRALRNYYGLHDVAIADGTGIKRTSVGNKLRGNSPVTAEELYAFAAFFGVPVEILYWDKGQVLRWVIDNESAIESSPAAALRSRCFAQRPSAGQVHRVSA